MFASLLAGEILVFQKEAKKPKIKSQNKPKPKANLTPQVLGILLLRWIMQKRTFSKDITRLWLTNLTGTVRLTEKAFKMRKITFKASIPTGGKIPRLCACWDIFSFHFVVLWKCFKISTAVLLTYRVWTAGLGPSASPQPPWSGRASKGRRKY